MHNVTKLMEISLDFMVLKERGPTFTGLGEVGHHGCNRKRPFSIRPPAARLEAEAGRMAILPFPDATQSF